MPLGITLPSSGQGSRISYSVTRHIREPYTRLNETVEEDRFLEPWGSYSVRLKPLRIWLRSSGKE